jgi:peptide/nickel transport system substrate-binding protein
LPRHRDVLLAAGAGAALQHAAALRPAGVSKVVGDLADSWTTSDDKLTYTFKLKQGVTFHDGSSFDSADIKATFDRIRQPPEGITSSRQGQWANIDTIETPDAETVVFTLKNPNPAQELLFANPWNCVYSAEKLAENPNYPATEVMGTGPFVFVEHNQGSNWKASRNENYFEEGRPYLDGIEAVFINGPGIINALAGNQVDAALFSVSPADQARLAQTNPDLVYQNGPFNITNFVTFNLTKAPFDDVRVRQAMNLAVSRAEADQVLPKISVLEGRGLYFPPGSIAARTPEEVMALPGMNDDTEANREQAKALLKEAGHEGLKLTLAQPQPAPAVGAARHLPARPVAQDRHERRPDPGRDAAVFRGAAEQAVRRLDRLQQHGERGPERGAGEVHAGQPEQLFGARRSQADRDVQRPARRHRRGARAKIVKDIEAYILDQAYFIPGFLSKRGVAHHKRREGLEAAAHHGAQPAARHALARSLVQGRSSLRKPPGSRRAVFS